MKNKKNQWFLFINDYPFDFILSLLIKVDTILNKFIYAYAQHFF